MGPSNSISDATEISFKFGVFDFSLFSAIAVVRRSDRPKNRPKPPLMCLRFPGFGLWGLIIQVFSKRRDVGSADLETGDHPFRLPRCGLIFLLLAASPLLHLAPTYFWEVGRLMVL